ncbi:MAG: bifunctional [glutamate--ammonia ligase]-adenylyl-L-tyrosine phosphorylase/[glutamate--ammonia-ligase] adenylyltransferase [Proteobacteria bacterium]|nr:bifunctional [glutamate--ammonia ligase]-adenylyl-L-tyrosine phosphorylase/[glutamate--ammonia-ligase] adenylyltransferase [Pseudomonadota bacterium]
MEVTLNSTSLAAIRSLPENLQSTALRWFERYDAAYKGREIPKDMIAALTRVVACSDFAASTALKEWSWLEEHRESLQEPPESSTLIEFARSIAASDQSIDTVKQQLRQFRNRYLLRVIWREIEGNASLRETLIALSTLADRLLDGVAGYARRLIHDRYGVVCDEDGEPVPIVILGMGKLGGNELNFSSDIDLIFLYSVGIESDGKRRLSAQEYFTRLSRYIVSLLDEVTSDGFVFRVDTRLRPFGDSGPPVVSFAALESYLLQHGRSWERYAYIKARIVGPAPPARIANELNKSLIAPFVYRRYLDYGVFESLRDMQALIAAEVRRRELSDNIKLGPGGIREIEFIVQSLQLVRGGRQHDLQERELQTVLPRLVGHHVMSDVDARELLDAYKFLRRIENFIQAIRDQQTHELPIDEIDRARLCLAMRYQNWDSLLQTLETHRRKVTRQFEKITFRSNDDAVVDRLKKQFRDLWGKAGSAAEWTDILDKEGFAEASDLALSLTGFANMRATQQIDVPSRQRLRKFIPELLILLKDSTEPLLALRRTLAVIEKVVRRSAYIALLNENAHAMRRLVNLCERSAYVAGQIARYPMLLDELLDPRIYSTRMTRENLDVELQQRMDSRRTDDGESQIEILGQFQRSSQFRIALADLYGGLPIMRVSDCLTDLAEAVLNHALSVVWEDMTNKHGVPEYLVNGGVYTAGFGIIAYGKLGGLELSYGSDLDLVFLHNSHGEKQMTNGEKRLDNSMFFMRLVRRLVHLLTVQTGSGLLYEVDTRLRPDGQSGLLVTSVDAYEQYQEENAWTWEHQALLRARPVADNAEIAREFERIRADTLTDRVHHEALCDDVMSMRRRMRGKLDKSDAQYFDLKQGSGGISDIEFIVQYLVLKNARGHRSVIRYSDNMRQLDSLAAAGCLAPDLALRLQYTYRMYRLRLHHLSLDDRPSIVDKDDFVSEREFIREVWDDTFGIDSS